MIKLLSYFISIMVYLEYVGHLAGILVGLLMIYGPLKKLIDFIVPDQYKRYNRVYRNGSRANSFEHRNFNHENFHYFRN
jgi:hypothetical protein